MTSTFRALAIFSRLSNLGPKIPRSILLIDSILSSVASANCSWVKPLPVLSDFNRLPNLVFKLAITAFPKKKMAFNLIKIINLAKSNFLFNRVKLRFCYNCDQLLHKPSTNDYLRQNRVSINSAEADFQPKTGSSTGLFYVRFIVIGLY